jgi:hypothetical protein
MNVAKLLAISGIFFALSGCQCCLLTEHYMDAVDCIADRYPSGERFYCPGLDLTRIGYPDWCSFPLNRHLFGSCCCRGTRPLPQYVHNPIYLPQNAPKEPIQEVPENPAQREARPDDQLNPVQDPSMLDQGDGLTPEPALPPPPIPIPPAPTTP